jgi:hypothetical protein
VLAVIGYLLITAFTDGGNPVRFWALHLFQGNWIALLILIPAACQDQGPKLAAALGYYFATLLQNKDIRGKIAKLWMLLNCCSKPEYVRRMCVSRFCAPLYAWDIPPRSLIWPGCRSSRPAIG